MCITMATAELKGTLLYAGLGNFDGKDVHVLAYQNTARSAGPNAMILPIPAAAPLDHRNAIDTRKFRDFLATIQAANSYWSVPQVRSQPENRGRSAQVFDVGTYTVVLAKNAQDIAEALDQVPVEKRPQDNGQLFASFDDLYPGWPLAVCCWNGGIAPEPLMWWYEPRLPQWLFAPALDAHDGAPPQLDAEVAVDHLLAFGSSTYSGGNRVMRLDERDGVPREACGLFPRSVHGTRIRGSMNNGDFWLKAANLAGPALRRAPRRGSAAVEVRLDGWDKSWSDP